jgi:periplasmic protein TonB
MKFLLGILAALFLHGLVLTFGGIFFLDDEEDHGTLQQVELLTEDVEQDKEEEKKEEQPVEAAEELQSEDEAPPDSQELLDDIERSSIAAAPALDAASLGALAQALGGGGGGGEFADALNFASGGRIGGMGKAGGLDDKVEAGFTLAEIDQKARVIFQAAPLYPAEMRGTKVEGVVTLIFVVDETGAVSSPKVERSSHAAFDKPALDAVKQWKYEPAIRGGQRVMDKIRVSIRFQPS